MNWRTYEDKTKMMEIESHYLEYDKSILGASKRKGKRMLITMMQQDGQPDVVTKTEVKTSIELKLWELVFRLERLNKYYSARGT